LTLSYCWGTRNKAPTTEQNLHARASQIDIHELPQTIQDAIEVTRALGERFLWADAICIIQSDKPGKTNTADWQGEASKMHQYYANSYCTIAAAILNIVAMVFLQDPLNASSFRAILVSNRGLLLQQVPREPVLFLSCLSRQNGGTR
jgi:Heterokaryon incompatibility protein (HET)